MNDIEGKPCSFCSKPINIAEGYTVAPREGGEAEVYHNSENRRCYQERQRQNNHGNNPLFH